MTMSELASAEALELQIQKKNLNAPRVTLQDIKDNIKHVEYVKHVTHSGQIMRWCIITLQNGFPVDGRPSISASPENDDAELGEKRAYEYTFANIAPFMVHAMRDKANSQKVV